MARKQEVPGEFLFMSKLSCSKLVSFMGNKWKAAKHYPAPKYDTIIEPFAGFAGYALNYPYLNVELYDRDDYICAVWDYLINVSEQELLALPDYPRFIEDYKIPQEAKYLIGYWLNPTSSVCRKRASPWTLKLWENKKNHSVWGPKIKNDIATNLCKIRHWKVKNMSYKEVDNKKATWFIDPPYMLKGKHYRCSSKDIDFAHLANWCRSREGQVIVCENSGADWLPFTFLRKVNVSAGPIKDSSKSAEVIYYQEDFIEKQY